jgi:thiosulfate/3-mercaptopyruvate sulfurtransferase
MTFTTLLQPADLLAKMDDPDWLVVDCRFELSDPDAGEAAWLQGHVPGAVYAHMNRDLAGPVTPRSGRHPLPAPRDFARLLSAWGVTARTQVVAYDASAGMLAARLWWMLRWMGHDAVAVLDGGLQAWTAAGGGLDRSQPRLRPGDFVAQLRPDMAVDTTRLLGLLDADSCLLVDARSQERFEGRAEPLDPVAGHVPGAVNHPCQWNLDDHGCLLSPAGLSLRWQQTLGGRSPAGLLVCMCGSGITACHDLLAMEIAGIRGARLYPGSWSEWIRDPSRAIARGAA